MNKELKTRKPKAGLLLIASPRFKNLYGPKRGTYGERKDKAVKEIKDTMNFLNLVDPGIVYEREDAQRAMDLFYSEKVDFIYAAGRCERCHQPTGQDHYRECDGQ